MLFSLLIPVEEKGMWENGRNISVTYRHLDHCVFIPRGSEGLNGGCFLVFDVGGAHLGWNRAIFIVPHSLTVGRALLYGVIKEGTKQEDTGLVPNGRKVIAEI